MNEDILLFAGTSLVLVWAIAYPLLLAREAERKGELRYWLRYRRAYTIRRSEEPDKFKINLLILRAVPWIGFTMLAFAALIWGIAS